MIQRNVLEYLEATAERLPDKTAFADDKESLTFAQLLKGMREHPTYNEGIGEALEEAEGGAIHVVPKKKK